MKIFRFVLAAFLISPSFSHFASATVSAMPSWVRFTHVRVGNQDSQTVWLRNDGEDIQYLRADIMMGDRNEFDVDTIGCWSLRKNQSCTIRVIYRPHRAGNHSATLSVGEGIGLGTWIDLNGDAYDR